MVHQTDQPSKKQELTAFAALALLMGPLLAVAIVSGYGFLVWIFQIIAGPPGSRF